MSLSVMMFWKNVFTISLIVSASVIRLPVVLSIMWSSPWPGHWMFFSNIAFFWLLPNCVMMFFMWLQIQVFRTIERVEYIYRLKEIVVNSVVGDRQELKEIALQIDWATQCSVTRASSRSRQLQRHTAMLGTTLLVGCFYRRDKHSKSKPRTGPHN